MVSGYMFLLLLTEYKTHQGWSDIETKVGVSLSFFWGILR